jgi:DNA-binding SARP family transcriptional activator
MTVDRWALSLNSTVVVDVQITTEWASRLIEGNALEEDLTVSQSRLDALDLLPGWDDDWVVLERELLRQRMLHGLDALSRRLLSAGRYADAIEAAMLAISAEPLRESAQRALIEAHMAQGNVVEARRGYYAYHRLTRLELGVNPSSDLLSLLQVPLPP